MMIMKHLIQSGHALGQIHLTCVCFNQTVKRQKCINSGKMFKRVYKGVYGAHHDTTTARASTTPVFLVNQVKLESHL